MIIKLDETIEVHVTPQMYNDILCRLEETEDLPIITRILKNTKEKLENKPINFWATIEEHLPNYDSRLDILECDIIKKYIDGQEISNEDAEWLAGEPIFPRTKALDETIKRETLLYIEAVDNKKQKENEK